MKKETIYRINKGICSYDEAYSRESSSDIGWCGKYAVEDCPYNQDKRLKE